MDVNKTAGQDKLAVILIAFFCFILYFNSLLDTFTLDDLHMVVNNLYIKNFKYLPVFFKGHTTSFPVPRGMLRPVLMMTFSFNYMFSRLEPLGYHIINILLHILNAILFYMLLRMLKRDLPFKLVLSVVFLFCAHPVNTEAVTYISSRSDLLVTMFIISGLINYILKRYSLSLLFYLGALFSKETAIVFPLLILGYDFIFCETDYSIVKPCSRIRAYLKMILGYLYARKGFYIVLVVLSLAYLFYRKIIFNHVADIYSLRSAYSNILTQSAVAMFYIRLFLWPSPLTIHHAFPIFGSILQPVAAVSVLALLGIGLLVVYYRRRYPLCSFGLAWYLICLFPKFCAGLNYVATEHHFYLPGLGVYLFLTAGVLSVYKKFRKEFAYVFIGIICVVTVLVWVRNYEWKDNLSLWKAAVQRDSRSATAHNNLGIEYMRLGLYEEAEEEFRLTMSLSDSLPTRISPRLNLAAIYKHRKNYKEAIDMLNEALKMKPDYFATYLNLGVVCLDVGDEEKAEQAWKTGLRCYQYSSELQVNLGILNLKRGDLDEAQKYFSSALDVDPDCAKASFGLGRVFEEKGDIPSAFKAYEKSVEMSPSNAEFHYYLGTLYAKNNDIRAIRELKEAIELNPGIAAAHNNLAVLYASLQPPELELARKHAKKAQELGHDVKDGFLKHSYIEE